MPAIRSDAAVSHSTQDFTGHPQDNTVRVEDHGSSRPSHALGTAERHMIPACTASPHPCIARVTLITMVCRRLPDPLASRDLLSTPLQLLSQQFAKGLLVPTDAFHTRQHAALLILLCSCHLSHAVTTFSLRSYGPVEAPMPTGRHRGCPESSWSSESSVCCRSCCCGRLARPWRADACLCAALACRMMAYAGSGRCGVLDKVAVLSCDCTRLVSCICSKIQCPNADSVRFWIDSDNVQLGCKKIRSELTMIYSGTLAYCRAVRKCTA